MYEYVTSYHGTIASNGYLTNGLDWWTITPCNSSDIYYLNRDGYTDNNNPSIPIGVRPSINLKSNIKIVNGDGTENNPYRLEGDNDSNLSGTPLNTRYSGEYISFGVGENNLYRIVSHENGAGTKITSAESLKDSEIFKTIVFDSNDNANYSSSSTIGTFLNEDYLTNYVGNEYSDMIEDSTTWYLGTVGDGTSYKLAKYTDNKSNNLTSSSTMSKVGLLRLGELMSGQFDIYSNNINYWILTPYNPSLLHIVSGYGSAYYYIPSDTRAIKPSLNLKSNVIITDGTGTEFDPFVLKLDN